MDVLPELTPLPGDDSPTLGGENELFTTGYTKDLQISYYLYDHLGNTRIVFHTTYDCKNLEYVAEYVADYYPFGKILREWTPCEVERYLTTQHERDKESGYDYRGARFYDADLGRFLSTDPLAKKYAAWSPYAYVLDNPVAFVDPTGMSADSAYVVTLGGKSAAIGGEGGNDYDVVTYASSDCFICADTKVYGTQVYVNKYGKRGTRVAPGKFVPDPLYGFSPASGTVNSVESPIEWALEALPKASVKGFFLAMALFKKGAKKEAAKITVIGKMDDLTGYTDEVYDTWWKSGRIPGPGESKVSWPENRAWLDARIERGDKFMIATDPATLPPAVLKIGQEMPRGYFTAKELKYLTEKGIEVINGF